jgi:hypothetical protein
MDLFIKGITASGAVSVGSGLSVTGGLSVSGWFAPKPWVAIYVTSSGIGGTISSNVGYNQTGVSISHPSATGVYTISFPTHINGSYIPMVVQQTNSIANGGTIAFATCNQDSGSPLTTVNVFLRKDFTGTLLSGNFYFYTVP